MIPAWVVLLATAAQDPSWAAVTLSNGERHEGIFSMTPGRRLEIFETRAARRLHLDPAEIARVSVTPDVETMEQAWMFKEESDHTKILLPWKYPLRRLRTEVTVVSGETFQGRVVGCVFFLENEEDRRRFILTADQKGEKGQALEDLPYVRQIVFPNRPVGGRAPGSLKVPPGPAAAVDVRREVSFQSPLAGLPVGRYDVFLFGEARVRYGLAGEKIQAGELREIQAKVDLIEEFYTRKRLIDAAREGGIIRALVELTRAEESHDKGWRYARWEVWTFEPTAKSWDLRRRLFLHRVRIPAERELPRYEYAADPRLSGVPENAVVE